MPEKAAGKRILREGAMPKTLSEVQLRRVEELCERLYDTPTDELDQRLEGEGDDGSGRDRVRRLLGGTRGRSDLGDSGAPAVLDALRRDDLAADGRELEGVTPLVVTDAPAGRAIRVRLVGRNNLPAVRQVRLQPGESTQLDFELGREASTE